MKVKRLQSIEDLILENELIGMGNSVDSLIAAADGNRGGGNTGDGTNTSGESSINANEELDRILDMLLMMNFDDLAKKFEEPTVFERTFGRPEMKKLLDDYFKYISERIHTYIQQLEAELDKENRDDLKIKDLNNRIIHMAARIEILEHIYTNLRKDRIDPDMTQELLGNVTSLKQIVSAAYAVPVKKMAEHAKAAYSKFESAQSPEEQAEAAAEMFETVETAEAITEDYPADVKEGVAQAAKHYSEKVASKMGADKAAQIKDSVYMEKDTTRMVRDIFEFQYESWNTKEEVNHKADRLRTSVNGLKMASPEAKEYLNKLIDEAQKRIITKLESKEFDTKSYKGIHYGFNKKLPLYERVSLPVTGKQIADEHIIMRLRKGMQSIIDVLFSGGNDSRTKEGAAYFETGRWAHEIYAKTLNKSAMAIGKALGGREGEMKADAISRLFIPNTKVVDAPKPKSVVENSEPKEKGEKKVLLDLGIIGFEDYFDIEWKDSFDHPSHIKTEVEKAEKYDTNGVKIVDISGVVTDDMTDMTIQLSDGTEIHCDAGFPVGPPNPKRKEHAIISYGNFRKDMVDEYQNNLENYGSVILAIMKCYEMTKKPDAINEFAGTAASPGVSPQVPGSISAMGPIEAPTADGKEGSGDKFQHEKKKKKKKKVFENRAQSLSIGDPVTLTFSAEDLQNGFLQAVDGLTATVSLVYTNPYEPGVNRYEVELTSAVEIDGDDIITVPGLYDENLIPEGEGTTTEAKPDKPSEIHESLKVLRFGQFEKMRK